MKIKSFFVISRWEYMPSAINEVGIPALLALLFVPFTSGFLWMIAFSLIVWWGGHFIGSHINCLNDYDVDKLYKNYLTKAVDDIGPQNIKKILWIETILLTFLVVSLTIVLNKPLLIVFWGLGLLLAFGYSCKPVQLKSRTLMNPIALGLVLYIFPMFFSYLLLAKNLHTFSTVIIILFSIQMVPMFFMDEISDYEEDKQCKINNPCVRYGRKKTILMAIVIYVLSAIGVCSYVVFNFKLLNSAHWILFLISTLFFCYVTLDFISIFRLADKEKLKRDTGLLLKLKKRIITPVWLMGSGVATILLILVTLVR